MEIIRSPKVIRKPTQESKISQEANKLSKKKRKHQENFTYVRPEDLQAIQERKKYIRQCKIIPADEEGYSYLITPKGTHKDRKPIWERQALRPGDLVQLLPGTRPVGGFKNGSDRFNYDDKAIVTKYCCCRCCKVCLAIPDFRYFSFHPDRLHHCTFERRSTILFKTS